MPVKLKEYAPLTWVVERIFRGLQLASPASWLVKSRVDISNAQANDPAYTKQRAFRVEVYVVCWLFIEALMVAAFVWSPFGRAITALIASIAIARAADVFQTTVNVALFDAFRLQDRRAHQAAGIERLAVLAFINFLELLVCFGCLYALAIDQLKDHSRVWDAWYFSVVTQLTIGYGDIQPLGIARVIVVAQSIVGLAFLVLVFARVISALPVLSAYFTARRANDR